MRSKLLFLVLLAVGILVIGSSVHAENVVVNPGFEDVTGTTADNWVHWGWNGGAATVQSDSGIALSGNYLQSTSGGAGGSGVYQTFDALEGEFYAISAWAKTTDAGSRATIVLVVLDDAYQDGVDSTELLRTVLDIAQDGVGAWKALPEWTYGELEIQLLSENFDRADPTIVGQLQIKIEVANNPASGTGTTAYFDNIAGYLGGLPNKLVKNPSPLDGATAVSPTTSILGWERSNICPDANSMIEVWWGIEDDPNFWTAGPPVKIMNLKDTDSFNLADAIIGAISLDPDKHYYWALKYEDPNGFECTWGFDDLTKGPAWTFDTINGPPDVDAGDNLSRWLPISSGKIGLDATVDDDGLPVGCSLSYEWGAVTGVIYDPSNDGGQTSNVEDPNITIAVAGDYLLTLTVDDGEFCNLAEYKESFDSILIRVFSNDDSRLKAHWPLDEASGDPCDVAGGHNGSLVGTPTQGVDGQVDGAVLLTPGDGYYITIPDTGTDPNIVEATGGTHSWENQIEDGITVSAWMRLDADGWSTDWETIVGKSQHGWELQRAGGGDNVRFVVRGQNDDPCNPSIFNSGDTSAYSDTAYFDVTSGWHQIVGTFDGNKVNLYVDGMPAGSLDTNFDKIAMDPSAISIGTSTGIGGGGDLPWNEDRSTWTSTGNAFEGNIDEVKIFDAPVPYRADHAGTPGIVEMFREDGGHGSCGGVYLVGDQNFDCYITLIDFAIVAFDWLDCTDVANADCTY